MITVGGLKPSMLLKWLECPATCAAAVRPPHATLQSPVLELPLQLHVAGGQAFVLERKHGY